MAALLATCLPVTFAWAPTPLSHSLGLGTSASLAGGEGWLRTLSHPEVLRHQRGAHTENAGARLSTVPGQGPPCLPSFITFFPSESKGTWHLLWGPRILVPMCVPNPTLHLRGWCPQTPEEMVAPYLFSSSPPAPPARNSSEPSNTLRLEPRLGGTGMMTDAQVDPVVARSCQLHSQSPSYPPSLNGIALSQEVVESSLPLKL